jgi:hypothetical protein
LLDCLSSQIGGEPINMKNLLKKLAIVGSTLALSLTLGAAVTFAATTCTGTASCFNAGTVDNGNPISLQTQFGFGNLSQALNTIVAVVFFGGALAAFVFIVIGAFRYLTSGDSDAGTKAARVMITNAVVGLILLALVYVIFQIIIRVVPGLQSVFGTTG